MFKNIFKTMQVSTAIVIACSFLFAKPVGAQPPFPVDPTFTIPSDAVALSVTASVFAPGGDASSWTDGVCSGMTTEGCEYFKNQQAGVLLKSNKGTLGDSVNSVDVVSHLKDGSQLWKVSVTIFKKDGADLTQDAYVQVVYDQVRGQWLLNRVLCGPYINL